MSKINALSSSPVDAIVKALRTLPAKQDWAEAAFLFMVFITLSGYLGLSTGLFKFELTSHWAEMAIIAVIAIFIPALAEEITFRVFLPATIPHWIGILVGLITFVAWHTAQFYLDLPMAQPIFNEPIFLGMVTCLGAICALSYYRSKSIWPAVAIHWAIVVIWKGFTIPA